MSSRHQGVLPPTNSRSPPSEVNSHQAKSPSHQSKEQQRNKCTSLRLKAIKEHFKKKSESGRENPREFWDTCRPFLNSKTKPANDIVLKENEVPITNKKQIAELMNNHFVKVTEILMM